MYILEDIGNIPIEIEWVRMNGNGIIYHPR
jgi:hypothetical protein